MSEPNYLVIPNYFKLEENNNSPTSDSNGDSIVSYSDNDCNCFNNFDQYVKLIPDLYQRETNKNVLVEFIYDVNEDRAAKSLQKCLEKLDYHVNVTNAVNQYKFEINYNEILTTIEEKVNDNDYDGLIMVFSKQWIQLENLKNIWNKFTSLNCLSLKNKPKIFIFQIMEKKLDATDGSTIHKRMFKQDVYNTPSEADITLIVDKYDYKSKNDLLLTLKNNIIKYSGEEHLHTLITISKCAINRPLLLSTMTKKFYFTIDQYRGLIYRKLLTVSDINISLDKEQNGKKNRQSIGSRCVIDGKKQVPRQTKLLKEPKKKLGNLNDRPAWRY